MRLTEQILRASDDAELELIGKALALGSAGRFGLFTSHRPFKIILNIGRETVDIESLNCLAITKEGQLIDVNYQAKFDKAFETKVALPYHLNSDELFLTISPLENQWKEIPGGYEEPIYQFRLLTANSPIPDDALPIAHLVNNENSGWMMDDTNFVPPCLFVSSHPTYEELFSKFLEVLSTMNEKAHALIHSEAQNAMRTFWPMLQQIAISTDKDRELLTPMMFLGLIQRFICAFTTSCELDENIGLTDASTYYHFAFSPYNPQNSYQKIKEGVGLCLSIREKIDKIQTKAPEPMPETKVATPFITDDQLYRNCRDKTTFITVSQPTGNATTLYSTDGSEPSRRLPSNSQIVLENGFHKHKAPEPDKKVVIKLKSIVNGVSSEEVSFTITMHKDCQVWNGYEI